jgi:hypothetical protein
VSVESPILQNPQKAKIDSAESMIVESVEFNYDRTWFRT